MDLKEIVSIAGIGGLKRIVKQRQDGLIVSEMDGSDKKFMSNRVHMFTPLENISIYTDNDSESLGSVLWKMKCQMDKNPPISPKSNAEALKSYMASILPNYDRNQVFISDIKKLINWFDVLNDNDLITDPTVNKEETNTSEADNTDKSDAEPELLM